MQASKGLEPEVFRPVDELIPKADYLWNQLKGRNSCLSKEEACACLARYTALLEQVHRQHSFEPPRLRKLNDVCVAFEHSWGNQNSFLYIGYWAQAHIHKLISWLTSGKCHVPADLRKRMATLLWSLGERHFPYGIRTPAVGNLAFYDELEVLRWWRMLPHRDLQETALQHAESEREKLSDNVVAAMGKHTAHAWISATLLITTPFQSQAASFLRPDGSHAMDKWQHTAATYCGAQPLLIEAGPGAGKTRTMAARCIHIFAESVASAAELRDIKMRAEDVVAVTFTNAAARELRKRLENMNVPRPSVSTMDKFCLNFIAAVMNRARWSLHSSIRADVLGPRGKLLYIPKTEERRKAELKSAIREEEPDKIVANEAGRSLEAVMAAAFNRADKTTAELNVGTIALLDAAQRVYREHRLLAAARPTEAAVKDICEIITTEWQKKDRDGLKLAQPPVLVNDELKLDRLTKLLTTFAALLSRFGEHAPSFDFDKELLALALVHPGQALRDAPSWVRHEGVLAAAKATAALYATKHYIIDELQDTSPAQLRLFSWLAAGCHGEGRGRLTMVGDCDQSIYGFRGARWASLHAEFFGAGQVHRCPLKLNYRSTPAIVAACTALITPNYKNLQGQQKELRAKRSTPAYPVRLVVCKDEASEHAHVFAAIQAWNRARVCSSAIAVLFRNRPGDGGMENFLNYLKTKNFDSYVLLSDEKEESEEKRKEPKKPLRFFVGTIHAAKGREWPIVYVVGLSRATRWLANFLPADYPIEQWAAEERRCAYVATSRAEGLLHVTHSGDPCPDTFDFIGDMCKAGPQSVQTVDLTGFSLDETVTYTATEMQYDVTLIDPEEHAKLMLPSNIADQTDDGGDADTVSDDAADVDMELDYDDQ